MRKDQYRFYPVEGISVGVAASNKNKWGRGYDVIIDNREYVIGSEGMYDNTRPIKSRSGEEIYLSTLETIDGDKPDDVTQEHIIKAIKAYAQDTDPDYFREFV